MLYLEDIYEDIENGDNVTEIAKELCKLAESVYDAAKAGLKYGEGVVDAEHLFDEVEEVIKKLS